MPRVPPINESIWHDLGIWYGTQQQFNHSLDQSINFVSNGIRYCLTLKKPDHLLFKDCLISISTWINDAYRMYFMEAETKGCLTAVKDKMELLPCGLEPHSVKQMWKFDFKNTDETFRRANSNFTIEDWEFVQEELRSSPAISTTDVEILFNWGNLLQPTRKRTIDLRQPCLTDTEATNSVTLENCRRQEGVVLDHQR